jgi:hypothetical protein
MSIIARPTKRSNFANDNRLGQVIDIVIDGNLCELFVGMNG